MKKKQLKVTQIAIGGGLAIAAVTGAVCLAAASMLARVSVRVDRGSARPVTVIDLEPGDRPRVWLAGEGVAAAGKQSLLFDAPGEDVPRRDRVEATGHARLGPVLEKRGRSVLREVEQVDRGILGIGSSGRMVGWWFTSPNELGFRVESITYETELGPMDAWLVHPKRARGNRWAIHTHGRGASPAETLRGVAPIARAGITSLIINYRNDPGQPPGINEAYGMGIAESHDVDAAIGEAVRRGAKRVTLIGWSMGGTASLVAATIGPFRDVIDGLVLDSPGIDWPEILLVHGRANGVSKPVVQLGMKLLSRGCVSSGVPGGVDLASLTPQAFAAKLELPTMIITGPGDRFVSWEGARTLASLRPEIVQLCEIEGAGHVRLWNRDPERWENAVVSFVQGLHKPQPNER